MLGGFYMNKNIDGKLTSRHCNNICGQNIKELRLSLPTKTSQRAFAEMLQVNGLDVDKNVIQRIEAGTRTVTDVELKAIAKTLGVSYGQLLDDRREE